MRSLFLLLILTLGVQSSFAKKVKLFGQHAAYANAQIKVLCYDDAFSKTEKELAILQLDRQGQFSVEFEIAETQMVFLPLGVFRGYFFAETGKEYQLSLPPRRDLSPSQRIDPFFEPQDVLLGFRNTDKDGLNSLIREFDNQFDNFINQNFDDIYNQRSSSVGVGFAKQMKSDYVQVTNTYFQVYLKYRLGFLDYLASPEAYISLESKYFTKQALELNNTAYTTLFNKIYDNSLSSAFHRKEKSKFNKALESSDPYSNLSKVMQSYTVYQDKTFRDLLLAKAVFNGTENAVLSRSKAIEILQKINENSTDSRVSQLIKNYLVNLSHLLKNTDVPNFKLGDIVLEDYKGKYLYLNFCNTTNSVWENDLESLKKLHEAFGKDIEFLSVASDLDTARFTNRLKQKDITWPMVQIDSENSILADFKINVFPTYIIINPEGKVYQYPARGPHDGVEKIFVKIQRNLLRKNYSQKK
ncbi:TlpA family protein disulfide reductase [Ancylomarina euxinus]|uniref:TlpA family protein disulfide reductase n=1 Tax=Ancylomarina euxinus TaxID=2283627 RepID=A0A425Y363_9BACT|nr:TlpA disulfide reductase family protein [Ancylomarina euxinus]MCZ4693152.1 TlpA disulfide reductase family protein [Ancylomarina euxinus]MUP15290.1 redoxin domain-containing protein [Ancylomarina euxinus]RRG22580.1 TlpA family protein disulfide reductase [Ancylomarina euxinus]